MSIGSDNFYISDLVQVEKVTFQNQFKMQVAGNLFVPKDLEASKETAALVVGHPMGAVKEQAANLYATKMAEAGFVTLALDLPFWGESAGEPRNLVAPDLYAEGFSAAVDFLRSKPFVNKEQIGGIGVCGSGGFLISAAKIDPRIKAVATISMYDMGGATRNGLGNSISAEMRQQMIAEAAAQRDVEFAGGETQYTGGCPHEIDEDSHPIAKEFYDFYRTPRGEFTPKGSSPALTTHPTLSSNTRFLNFYPFNDIEHISPRPLLFIAGEQAHSLEFSEQAYELASQPKELLLVKGCGHVDLYDGTQVIPFEKLESFFNHAFN
ncbi:alpha/beta hydrolase [Oceanospirillum sanctuarii]|uniref:alpha/beta hydrolase n=1 Tax=Oceanospirillum sanctuarii TaxID=1434821 RepID=UPI001C3D8116|nr:alpha/beta hydrolase [Oceanospirillum sanctuarii]